MLTPQYTVEREHASGGMGVVFLGTDVRLDRRVAIKVLRPDHTSGDARRRFAREARVLAKLQHRNIVPIHQADEVDGFWYFVMDFIDGPTLAQRLLQGPLEPDGVRTLGLDLLDALEAAHRARVVHRDVKPANIFLAGDRALLADFGIASVDDTTDPTERTVPGLRRGTPAYWAPEQIAGEPASPRTDIYAAGLVLYEAATGRRWPPAADPDRGDWTLVPRRLRGPLRKALALSPADRWQGAAGFRQALARRPAPLLVPAAIVAIVAIIIRTLLGGPAPPKGLRTDLAIVPFTRAGHEDPVGRRLARHAGNQLERFPRWRLTSVPASFAWSDSAGPEAQPAAALGTRYYAQGELLDGSRVQVSVRDSAGAPFRRFTVAGSESDLLSWGNEIADSIAQAIVPGFADEFREMLAHSGRSAEAYAELFAGQEAFRVDNLTEAETHYRRALDLDSTFAQAAWELALVRRWRERSFEPEWRRLYGQRERLTELQRLITAAQLEPDLPSRVAALRAAIRQYPRNAEALLLAADELHHRGPLGGLPLDSAFQWWDDASRLQPYFTAYEHLAVGCIRLGRRQEASRTIEAMARLVGRSGAEAHQRAKLVSLVYDGRFHPWLARWKLRWLEWTADSAAVTRLGQYVRLGLLFDAPEAQRKAGEVLIHRGAEPAVRANGHEAAGIALMAEGRPVAALAELDSAAALFATPESELERAEWRLMPAALGLPPADSAAADWARRVLAAAIPGPRAARAAFGLAVDAAMRGDTVTLARWRSALGAADSGAAFARLLSALLAARAADLDRALAVSDSLARTGGAGLATEPFARALLYLRRGDWLARTGAPEQADRAWLWYEGWDIEGWAQRGVQAGEVDAVLGGLARLRRADLAARRGDSPTRCGYATRARELWAGAEPSYAALRQRATDLATGCSG